MDGLKFTIATLRSVSSVLPIFQNIALKLPIIELNGAFITDLRTGIKLEIQALDTAIRFPLYGVLTESGVSPIILTHRDSVDRLYIRTITEDLLCRWIKDGNSRTDKVGSIYFPNNAKPLPGKATSGARSIALELHQNVIAVDQCRITIQNAGLTRIIGTMPIQAPIELGDA